MSRLLARRALATDVIVLASRRWVLWLYLLLGTTVAGLVPGMIELRGEQQWPAPSLSAAAALPAPGRVVPGTFRLETVEGPLLRDDGRGALVDARGAAAGRLVGDRIVLEREVAGVDSATCTWQVEVGSRAARAEAGAPTRLVLACVGMEFPYQNRLGAPAEAALLVLVQSALYQILLAITVSVFGVGLGLVGVADAVTSAFRPGAAPLLLPRPVCRSDVILARFAGGVLFGALQLGWVLALTTAVVWVKFELLPLRLLLAAAPLLLKFALLLAVASAIGVLLRSVVLGLVGAAGAWIVSFTVRLASSSQEVQESISAASGPLGLSRLLEWLTIAWPPITVQDAVVEGLCLGDDSPQLLWRMVWITGRGLLWTAALLGLTFLAVRRRDC